MTILIGVTFPRLWERSQPEKCQKEGPLNCVFLAMKVLQIQGIMSFATPQTPQDSRVHQNLRAHYILTEIKIITQKQNGVWKGTNIVAWKFDAGREARWRATDRNRFLLIQMFSGPTGQEIFILWVSFYLLLPNACDTLYLLIRTHLYPLISGPDTAICSAQSDPLPWLSWDLKIRQL